MIAENKPNNRRRPPEPIDLHALKRSIDLLALVRSRGHEPQRHGNNKWKINCPFHEDAKASLVITPSKALWRCFGCGKGGSGIDFLVFRDNLTTGQAIRQLAEKYGGMVKPAATIAAADAPTARTAAQQTLLNKVAEFYHKTFQQCPEGRAYLKGRGLHEAALYETFRIGYANETIRDAIPPEGEILDDLKAVGILDAHGKEHFRDCVTFPIYDEQSNVCGIYGRKLGVPSAVKGDKRPDGQADPIRHLYLPGKHVGVWHWQAANVAAAVPGDARASRAPASSYLLLTESIIDAATLWQAGYKNTTALYGTNGLTDDHRALFKRHGIERVYLVMDGDPAGRDAAGRLSPRLTEDGHEVFAVTLPEGEDANGFLHTNPVEAFDALLKAAQPTNGKTPLASAATAAVPQSDITRRQGTAQIEEIAKGFRVRFAERCYEVRPIETGATRIKVTVKALTPDRNRFHIDTVDLFSARSRKTFIADAVTLYREETPIIETDINRLIEECERRGEKQDAIAEDIIRLTDEARRDGERFGKRPDLFDEIFKDFGKGGYIGERANVLLAYLCMTSRKMFTPLALLILSGSGAGKSFLQDTALRFCPEEDLVKLTSVTERALFYKGETSLMHKVLALEEIAGGEDAAYAIRSLISAGILVIEATVKDPLTGRMTTMQNKVYGPTSVFQTTTNPRVNPETLSRFYVSSIDESREQTKRILEAQRAARTLDGLRMQLRQDGVQKRHHAFQRLLKTVRVINPYGRLLSYADDYLMTRRDNRKYLNLIEAVAFLHQMRKPVKQMTEEGQTVDYIEVSLRDIGLANDLALEVLGKTLDELTGPTRTLLLLIEELVQRIAKERKIDPVEVCITRREIREFSKWSDYQIRQHLPTLADLEYLLPVSGKNGSQFQYRLLWEGQGKAGERFMLGLKDVETLRREAAALGIQDVEAQDLVAEKTHLAGFSDHLAGKPGDLAATLRTPKPEAKA